MRHTSRLMLVSFGLALGVPLATSAATIDDFQTTVQALLSAPAGTTRSTATTAGSDILGSERDLRVSVISPQTPTSPTNDVTAVVTASGLTFTSASATQGELEIVWDGADADAARVAPTGLGATNLTAGGADALKVTVASATAGTLLLVEVWTDAAHSSTRALILPAVSASTDFFLSYSGFAKNRGTVTGADFTQVGAIRLFLRGTNVSATLTGLATAVGAPQVSGTLTDNVTQAAPGGTVHYTVTLHTANADAASVHFTDTLDANTTRTGTIRVSPIALDDAYAGVTEPLTVLAASGVLANDVDAQGLTKSVSASDTVTSRGGTVVVNADGSFTYSAALISGRPDVGVPDTFTYTLSDTASAGDGLTDTAVVTVTITDAAPTVTSTSPANNATHQLASTDITIDFSEPVNVTASAFTLECPVSTPIAFTNTTGTGPASSFVLHPTATIPDGVLCTATVVAAQVTDQDNNDPPDNMAANYVFTFSTEARPVVTTTGGTTAFTEAGGAVTVDSGLTVSDADSANLASAAVTITNLLDSGQETLAATTTGTSITASYAAPTLSLSGSDTLAHYQQVLRSVTYNDASLNPDTTTRTLSFTASDGALTSTAATKDVTVSAVNTAPVVTATVGATTFTEGGGAVAVDSGITVTDADNANLASATASIATIANAGQETLSATTTGTSITANYSAPTLTLSGTDTVAHYQQVLRTVTYDNASDNPTSYGAALTRTINFAANDGASSSATAAKTVNVAAVNDAPVLTAGATLAYTENGAAVAVDGTITVADADSQNLSGATVTISSNHALEDVLAFSTQNGISGSWDGTNGILTLTGSATLANYETALRSVTYRNTSDNPSTSARTITWQVNDGAAANNLSNQPTSTINITAVDDAPVVTTTSGTTSYAELDPATVIDGGVTATDADNTNLASATVTITNLLNLGEETLDADVSTTSITKSYAAPTLTLSGSDTVANYQQVLRSVTYVNASHNPTVATGTPGPVAVVSATGFTGPAVCNDGGGTYSAPECTARPFDTSLDLASVANGALAAVAKDAVSGADPIHKPQFANDGFYGNGASWASVGPNSWIKIDLGAVRSVSAVRIGRDRTGGLDDADPGQFQIAVATTENAYADGDETNDGTEYTTVFDSSLVGFGGTIAGAQTLEARFSSVHARYIKISVATAGATLDEVEVFGSPTSVADTSREIAFRANDGTLDSAVATKTLTLSPSNDAPVVTTTGGNTTFTANSSAVTVDGGVTATDADSATLASATVSITNVQDAGQETLAATTTGTSISASYTEPTLSLTGADTPAHYQQVLRTITYNDALSNPNTTTRVISFVANDGTASSATANKNVAVTTDQPAVVTTSGGTTSYTENGTVAVDGALTVTDSDSTNLTGATVSITTNFASAEDALTFTTQNGITGSYNPVTGVLTLSGTTTVANYQTALRTVSYTNSSDNPSTATRTMSFVANDGFFPSAAATKNVSITPVNDAPVVDLNGATAGNDVTVAFTEQTPQLIAPAATITDAEGNNPTSLTVTLTARPDGDSTESLSLNAGATIAAAGLTVGYTSGTGVLSITGSATLATYQTILQGILYNNTSDNPTSTSRSVTVVANDGAASTSRTSTITITGVNDPPVVDLNGATAGNDVTVAFTEQTPQTIAPAGTITDPESNNPTSLTATLAARPDGDGVESLSLNGSATTAASGLTVVYMAATGVLSISGSATLATYQTILQGIVYNDTSDTPTTTDRTVTVVVDDGAASTARTSTITVTAVNDAPVVDLNGATAGNDVTVAFTEQTPQLIAPAATITDAEGNNPTSLTVTLTARPDGNATESLSLNPAATTAAAGLTVGYTAATGVLSISGSATLATYQAILQGILYNNTSDNPTSTSRSVTVVANDGAASTSRTSTITITGVNDPPVVDLNGATAGNDVTVAFTEQTPQTIAPAGTITDPESNNPTSLTATLAARPDGDGVESLSLNGSATTAASGLTVVYTAATGVLSISGSAPLATYQTILQGIVYNDTSDTPTTTDRTVTVVVDDGAASTARTATITVTAVNDAPVVDLNGATAGNDVAITFVEQTPELIAPAAIITDAEGNNPTSLTVTLTARPDGNATESLSLNPAATTAAAGLTVGYTAATGVLSITGSATLATYQTILQGVLYGNTSDAPTTTARTVTVVANDGAASTSRTSTISISAVNDAPTVNRTATATINEDTALTFSGANLVSITDPDSGTGSIKITLSATHGTLSLNGTANLSFSVGDGSSDAAMTFTGKLVDVNAALSGMTYNPTANWNTAGRSAETVSIAVDDQGNTGSGGALTDSKTVAVTITAVNDKPVAAAKTYSAEAHMKISLGVVLSANGTGDVTDVDNGDAGFTNQFTLNLPVFVNCTPACANAPVISNLNASAGTFDFEPPAGYTGGAVNLTYTVNDNGNPTPSQTSAAATMTINVSGPVIWFVDGTSGSNANNGTMSHPFQTIAAAAAVHASDHRIFVYSGTYSNGLSMNTGEWLVGQGVTGTFDGVMGISPPVGTIARPSVGGTRPIIQNTVTLNTKTTNNVVKVLGIDLSTSSNTALTNGGTSINAVTVDVGSVTTTTGSAVSITGSGNGSTVANAMTFVSVSAGTVASGPPNGIALNNYTGSFTVTGDGSTNGSGGTIQSTSGHGISLASLAGTGVSLAYMNITNPGASGIQAAPAGWTIATDPSGVGVNNFALDHCVISDAAGNNTSDDGVTLENATGTISITSSSISGARHQGITLDNKNQNVASFTVSGTTVSNTAGGDGVLIQMRGTSVMTTGTVGGATSALGNTLASNSSTGLQVNNGDTGSIQSLTVRNNTVSNNNAGMDYDLSQNSSMTIVVQDNTITGSHSQALNLVTSTSSTAASMTATLRNNTIGIAGVNDSGSAIGNGIRVANGGVTTNLTIDGNVIREVPNGRGIDVEPQAYGATSNVKAKIVNNTIVKPSGTNQNIGCGANVPCPSASIFVLSDNNNVGTYENDCTVITGNTAYDPLSWPAGGEGAYYLARRSTGSNLLRLEGNTSLTAVANLQSTNTETNDSGNGTGFVDEGSAGLTQVVASGTCGSFP